MDAIWSIVNRKCLHIFWHQRWQRCMQVNTTCCCCQFNYYSVEITQNKQTNPNSLITRSGIVFTYSVHIDNMIGCPRSWSNAQNCVRFEFGIKFNGTALNEDQLLGLWLTYGRAAFIANGFRVSVQRIQGDYSMRTMRHTHYCWCWLCRFICRSLTNPIQRNCSSFGRWWVCRLLAVLLWCCLAYGKWMFSVIIGACIGEAATTRNECANHFKMMHLHIRPFIKLYQRYFPMSRQLQWIRPKPYHLVSTEIEKCSWFVALLK